MSKWLWIYEMYGEKLPTYVRTTKLDERPDADLWASDKNYKHQAYVDTGDYIYYGVFTSPNCFVVHNYQDINKTWEEFKKIKKFDLKAMYTAEDLKNMESRQWMYLDQVPAEHFCEDTEEIEEGYFIQTLYYPNNSIKSKTIIYLDTGELIYHYHWDLSVYFNEELQKDVAYIIGHERFDRGKHMKSKRVYFPKEKKSKWVIELPLSYKGKTLEEVYGLYKKANR